MTDRNLSRLTMPRMLFAEQIVAHGGGVAVVNQQDLLVTRDTIIDLIGLSEESYSGSANMGVANATYIPNLAVNWSLGERANFVTNGYTPLTALNSFSDADRSLNPSAVANTAWTTLYWRHATPWIYEQGDAVVLDWVIPAALVPAVGTAEAAFTLDSVGTKTGVRRGYQIRGVNFGQGLVVNIARTALNTPTMVNLSGEAQRVDGFQIQFTSSDWITTDIRLLNHFRVRVVPCKGEAWSDVPVPLIFYGPTMSPANRIVWFKPGDGPVLVKAGQSANFTFQNNHATVDVNAQVVLLGRTAPGVGSVV